MKYNAKQYARALYDAVDGKSPDEIKSVIRRFADILSANNDLAASEKIAAQFAKIWDRQKGFVAAETISARGLDKDIIDSIKGLVAERAGAKEVDISGKIDGSLLGGAIIKYEDKILDASLKSRLKDLKEAMLRQ